MQLNKLVAVMMTAVAVSAPAVAVEQLTPVNPGFMLNYPGVCSSRIALQAIGRLARGQDALPALIGEAEQAVDKLVAKCPDVQTIAVSARDARARDAALFTMSRANQWRVEHYTTLSGLESVLSQAGYQAAAGPRPYFAKAWWRVENGRFEAVYGHDLDNRLVATHIERADSGYNLRGQFYDSGFHESQRQCDDEREGYRLWGSFAMSVSTDNQALPMTIKWCAAANESGDNAVTELWDLPSNGAANTGSVVAALDAALSTQSNIIQSTEGRSGPELLIDREMFRVFVARQPLCKTREVDLVYRINHEARGSLFPGDYDDSIANTVSDLLGRRCGEILKFRVNAYSAGDEVPWDTTEYRYRRNSGEIPYQGVTVFQSEAAQDHRQAMAKQSFGPCSGAFCEYPGGRYLNAIYRGDLSIVRQIDALHREALAAFKQSQLELAGRMLGDAAAKIYDTVAQPGQVQLLPVVANKYMHAYGMWGDACLDPGAVTQPYRYVTPTVIETDEYGTTTSGGLVIETTYTNNPEFFPLRDKLASHKGANRSDDPANLAVKGAIFKGIVAMTKSGDCRSAEVKQFERNLRQLTETVMDNPGVEPPTASVRAFAPPPVIKPPFVPVAQTAGTTVAWNAPAPLPALPAKDAPRASKQPVPAAAQDPRLAGMAAMQKYEERMIAAQQPLLKARERGASQEELAQLTRQAQQEMQEALRLYQQELAQAQQ
ncbi:MAG: hypothetical protein AAFO81_06185 [Pseudomonadota bacterium]